MSGKVVFKDNDKTKVIFGKITDKDKFIEVTTRDNVTFSINKDIITFVREEE